MRKKRELAIASEYTVEVLGRRFTVKDMVMASVIVERHRDQTGMGASQMGSQFPVRDGANVIGYVSYNGRVWAGKPEDYGTDKVHLVYDPSEPAHRAAHAVPGVATPARVVRNNPNSGCYLHDSDEECREAPKGSCRYGGCDGTSDDGTCKTDPTYFADTKSFFCKEHRRKFLEDYRWDDRRGEWVERR